MQKKMWGVSTYSGKGRQTEHVEFTVTTENGEEYIAMRLEREKRIGTIEKTGENTYRFSADVYDSAELIPWIRTFICRITDIHISNRTVENGIKSDIEEMRRIYCADCEADE
jgi:hypothetical protein